MLLSRYEHFLENIGRAQDIISYGNVLHGLTNGSIDCSDLYRAGLVQAVSALDSYVHGVILDEMVEILMNRSNSSVKPKNIGLSIVAAQTMLSCNDTSQQENLARGFIAERLSYETYQKSEDIARAFSQIGIRNLWKSAFNKNIESVTTTLNLIVQRRNRIVHQCDRDISNPGNFIELLEVDAKDAAIHIESIVKNISNNI